jgi:hypothetical protein
LADTQSNHLADALANANADGSNAVSNALSDTSANEELGQR